ncbi:hypothetical protein ABPG72_010111 [Tetrahymena utriculariae]
MENLRFVLSIFSQEQTQLATQNQSQEDRLFNLIHNIIQSQNQCILEQAQSHKSHQQIDALSFQSQEKVEFSAFKQLIYSCKYKQGLNNNQSIDTCSIIKYEKLGKKQQILLLVDEKLQKELNAFFYHLNIKINQINFQQFITISDSNKNFTNIQSPFSVNTLNELEESRLDTQIIFQLQKFMEQMHSKVFNNKIDASDQLLQKTSATKLFFEIKQQYQINCIFGGYQFISVKCIIQLKVNQQNVAQINSETSKVLFQKDSFKQSQLQLQQQPRISQEKDTYNTIKQNQEEIKNAKKIDRMLSMQIACQTQNPNCLVCEISDQCKNCKLKYYNYDDINPFKILKSTSWVNIPFRSNENQSQINYTFNEHNAEGNIILSSSGAVLAIIYLFLIYKIMQLVIKKQNQNRLMEAYKKYICGLIMQLLIISTQVVHIGIVLQIVYFCINSENLNNDGLFILKILLVIVNSLLVVAILIFLYKQNNDQSIILDFQETLSIQDVNQNLIQSGCYSATWIQKNYNLSIIFKEIFLIPILVISLQGVYLAQLCSIFAVESIYLILLTYLRPFKESSDNIINIINCIIWLVIYILKLSQLIQIDGIKFSNDSNFHSSSQIVQTISCFEILLVILCFLVILSIQLAPIVKIFNKGKICESNIPLIKQIDALRQLQISAFGLERQNPSMFKIREEKLNELRFLQSYKKYRANSRFSLGSIIGIPKISISSLNPSPTINPAKLSQQKKSRHSEPLNREFILNALNDTNLNRNNNINNNSNSNNNFTVFDQTRQKNSILLIDASQNKEGDQKSNIKQINELREEYTCNSDHNIFENNTKKLSKKQNNLDLSKKLSEKGSINGNNSQSIRSSVDSSFIASKSSDSDKKLQQLYFKQ